MNNVKTISMCLCDRPDYARQVLEALRACDGIGDYLVLPHVEPGNEEVRALIEAIDFAECLPTFNERRLGVNRNTENALLDGFSFGDFVIHIEDDILLAPDALRYFEWAAARYAADSSVFSVTGYNRRADPVAPEDYHRTRLRAWFHPWGWGTWKNRWELFSGRLYLSPCTWDVFLNVNFCAEERTPCCHEVYPELARTQNIGRYSAIGSHMAEESWFFKYRYLKYWAGNQVVPVAEFHDANPSGKAT
ncbi:hypothetical protein V5E97_28370 [Singulisphaera sp. Ch08]|uniref:Glycosyltransferase n=1 Tax=Singulisphaera sp. Ch08 TaxID=3120278 RepID=A0AAU7CB86_9BACT